MCSVQPHSDPVMAMDLSPSGDHIMSAGGDSSISRSCFTISSTPKATPALISNPPHSTLTCSVKVPQASSSWARPTIAEEKASSSSEAIGTASDLASLHLSNKDAVQLPVKGNNILCLPFTDFFSDFIDTSTSSVSIVILLDTEIATSN